MGVHPSLLSSCDSCDVARILVPVGPERALLVACSATAVRTFVSFIQDSCGKSIIWNEWSILVRRNGDCITPASGNPKGESLLLGVREEYLGQLL